MIFYGGFGACIGRRVRFVRRPVVAGLIIGGVSEVNGRSGPGAAWPGAAHRPTAWHSYDVSLFRGACLLGARPPSRLV